LARQPHLVTGSILPFELRGRSSLLGDGVKSAVRLSISITSNRPDYISVRGEQMAKETVEAVRQAELRAQEKEKEALQKKEAIISEAEKKAKELIASMVKEANAKADKDLANARTRADEIIKEARAKSEKEIVLVKELAKMKEESAINLVLSEVIK